MTIQNLLQGLSTGGNVSAALDYMADCVCYQSICRVENLIFLLGQSSVYMVSVSDQVAQLESLIDRLFLSRNHYNTEMV